MPSKAKLSPQPPSPRHCAAPFNHDLLSAYHHCVTKSIRSEEAPNNWLSPHLAASVVSWRVESQLGDENEYVLIVLLSEELLLSPPAWGWFAEGHEIAAIIAAEDLTPTARSHVAQILGVPADTGSVEKAMAAASIRPDTEFRNEDRATAEWHYIDICLQDKESDLPARCPHGNCVTAKIDEHA
jgi:hypothetical protein